MRLHVSQQRGEPGYSKELAAPGPDLGDYERGAQLTDATTRWCEDMFISGRTAEYHVRQIMTRLGVDRTHLCPFRVVKAEPGTVCPGEGTSGSRGGSPARSVHMRRSAEEGGKPRRVRGRGR